MPRVDNQTFYDQSIKKYKQTPRGVHWNSKSSQEARFEAIAIGMKGFDSIDSLVDAGCGFGDLYHYLRKTDQLPGHYLGLDSHTKMVHIAKEKTKQRILHADILEDTIPFADLYVCSGAINTLSRYETFLFIKKMIEHAHKGVVFNLLKGADLSEVYNKFYPSEIERMLEPLNVDMEVLEGYLEGDFTMIVRPA